MPSNNLAEDLSQFYGSEAFHQWSPDYPHLLTDGVKFLCDEAKAYWLVDNLASHLHEWPDEDFIVAKLDVTNKKAELEITDGNENRLGFQKLHRIHRFPLDTITLWAIRNELNSYTFMLPREY
jgi:hypothetical protein